MSNDELTDLFALPDTGDVLGLRDRCILEVLYSCGLRCSEVTKLDIEDLDLARAVLTGKGGKSRVVPLGERAVNWLGRYLETVRPRLEIAPHEAVFFLTGYGEGFHPNALGYLIGKYLRAADIARGGPHLIRHTCATHLLEGGADIRYI